MQTFSFVLVEKKKKLIDHMSENTLYIKKGEGRQHRNANTNEEFAKGAI